MESLKRKETEESSFIVTITDWDPQEVDGLHVKNHLGCFCKKFLLWKISNVCKVG